MFDGNPHPQYYLILSKREKNINIIKFMIWEEKYKKIKDINKMFKIRKYPCIITLLKNINKVKLYSWDWEND